MEEGRQKGGVSARASAMVNLKATVESSTVRMISMRPAKSDTSLSVVVSEMRQMNIWMRTMFQR